MPELLEPEVVIAELKAMGCPYTHSHSRMLDWLEGYKTGYMKASDEAIARTERFIEKLK